MKHSGKSQPAAETVCHATVQNVRWRQTARGEPISNPEPGLPVPMRVPDRLRLGALLILDRVCILLSHPLQVFQLLGKALNIGIDLALIAGAMGQQALRVGVSSK